MTNQLNKEYKMKQNQLYSQLNQKDKIINGLELQVQRIQECLKESEEWGKNLELNKNKEIEKY